MFQIIQKTTHTVMAKGRKPPMSQNFEILENLHKAKLRPMRRLGTPIFALGAHTVCVDELETARID